MYPAVRQRRLRTPIAWVLFALLVLAAPAQADEELDQGRVYAIQHRAYRMNHEFSLSFGFLPLDAFYKMFTLNAHYVLHLSDLWAWEAVHFSWARYLSVDTGLKSELYERWDLNPTDAEEGRIDYAVDTNLMVKPLYGKMVLFDETVLHGETYLLLGIGGEKFQTAWYPAANVGAGLRVFLGDRISVRLEVREYVHYTEGFGSTLVFGLGFCYNAFAEERMPPDPGEVKP